MIDLVDLLHEAIAQRGPTPCQGPERDLWVSEDKADRRRAAEACEACPAADACRNLARAYKPTAGVWAGEDLTRRFKVERETERISGVARVCSRCDVVKPLEEFYRDHMGPQGRRSDCKACRNEYNQMKKAERDARSRREEAS